MVVPKVSGAFFDEVVSKGFDVVIGGKRTVGGNDSKAVVREGQSGCGSECEHSRATSPLDHATGKGSRTATHASKQNPFPVARFDAVDGGGVAWSTVVAVFVGEGEEREKGEKEMTWQ